MFALIQLVRMEWDKRKANRLEAVAGNVSAMTIHTRTVQQYKLNIHIILIMTYIFFSFLIERWCC